MKDWYKHAVTAIALVLLCACSGEDPPADNASTGQNAADWTRVSHFNTYTDGYGSVIAIAVVENVLDRPLEVVEVAMILKSADGEELDRTGGQIALLPPGAAIPLKVVFNDGDEADWEAVAPRVWRARRPEETAAYTGLALEDVADGNDPASSHVHQATGTVRNTGEANVQFVTIHAAFFNVEDELVAVAQGGPAGPLAPGDEADFSVGTNTAADDVARVQLTPMARRID